MCTWAVGEGKPQEGSHSPFHILWGWLDVNHKRNVSLRALHPPVPEGGQVGAVGRERALWLGELQLRAAGLESAIESLWDRQAPASLGTGSRAVGRGTSQRPCRLLGFHP